MLDKIMNGYEYPILKATIMELLADQFSTINVLRYAAKDKLEMKISIYNVNQMSPGMDERLVIELHTRMEHKDIIFYGVTPTLWFEDSYETCNIFKEKVNANLMNLLSQIAQCYFDNSFETVLKEAYSRKPKWSSNVNQ